MSFHEEEARLGKVYDHRLVRKLWPYLRPYRREMLFTCAALVAYAASQMAWPRVFAAVCLRMNKPQLVGDVRFLVVSFLILALGTGLAEFTRYYLSMTACQHLVADLRAALYRRFQRLPLSFFDRVPTGKVLSRLVHDPNALEDLLEVGFVTMLGSGLHLAGIMGIMVWFDWRLALLAFATVPVVVAITAVYRPMMRRAFRLVREMISRLNARMEENISGHSAVLVLNQEKRCAAELDEAADNLRRAQVRTAVLHGLFPPFIHGSLGAGVALILWYGAMRAMGLQAGAMRDAELEKLFTFVIYMSMFGWPLQMMMENVQVLQSAMAALERIFGFMEEAGDDLAAPAAAPPSAGLRPEGRARGRIEFRDVWFAYRDGEWVLKGLSFTAEPGERVAIAGPTGAGKTTVLSLASALYRPQRGQILLDGVDLAGLEPRYLRQQVATVIQDVFLFSDTVAENVRLWEPRVAPEDVRLACRRAHADFAEKFKEGYDHKLGQRGGDLSVGQRQLLSFARALAFDPPVLILDEATSSVDAETEEAIRQGLAELTHGRTSLIVAHRFSTLADAARLLVIRDGVVAEETTPRAFLAARRGR